MRADIDNAGKSSLIKFFKAAYREYPSELSFLIIFAFIVSILEIVGFASIIPVVDNIFNDSNDPSPVGIFVEKTFKLVGLEYEIYLLFILIFLVFLIKSFMLYFTRYYQGRIEILTKIDLQKNIYNNLLSVSWPYFLKKSVGEINNVIITQTSQAARGIRFLAQFIVDVIYIIFITLAAIIYSPEIVIMTLILAIAMFGIIRIVYYSTRELGTETGINEKNINQVVISTLSTPKMIKASNLGDYFSSWFGKIIKHTEHIGLRYMKITTALQSLTEPLVIGIALVVLFTSTYILNEPISNSMVIILMFYRLSGRMITIPKSYANTNYYYPLFQMCKDEEADTLRFKEKTSNVKLKSFSSSVKIVNLDFSYKDKKILKDINLEIPKGSFVGITGKSGCGKTTLVDLIMGLLKPQKGEIFIDDINLEKMNIFKLRNKFSYVGQDSLLLNLSIKENICLGEKNINIEKMKRSAALAHADEFIEELDDQYETIIGERGITLSGGQRQRLALANALYRDPEILILDEATSNLDTKSEKFIQQAIESLSGNITIIAIAHRLNTISNADNIIVMDKGMIIEQGKENDLIQTQKTYYDLINQ